MELIKFKLNGKEVEILGDVGESAKVFLRDNGIISLREGCDGEGACGLCSIILDGKVANSCMLVVGQLIGREVYTVAYFSDKQNMDKLQEAMVMAGIVQCGYCSPAIYTAFNRLLAENENPTKEDVIDALSAIYCRCTGYELMFNVVEIYKLLVKGEKLAAEKLRKDFRVIESSQCKIDSPRLVKGEKGYVEDIADKDASFLKFLGSPYASAFIKSIDTSEAENLPGVEYIITYKNAPTTVYGRTGQTYPDASAYDRTMFTQKLHHQGDRVAAVLAKNKAIAEEAIKLIKVEYEVLKPIVTAKEAIAEGAPVLHAGPVTYSTNPDLVIDYSKYDPRETPIHFNFPIGENLSRNIIGSKDGEMGSVAKAFEESDLVIEREYSTNKVNIAPMETHSVFTRVEDGRLIVHSAIQVPFLLRRIIAKVVGIPENKIRVIKEKIGGGFGNKQDASMEEVAAYLTWITGKSIYCRFTREEQFLMTNSRHNMDYKIKVGVKKDGTILGMDLDLLTNTGGYGNHAWTVGMLGYALTAPIFRIPNFKYNMRAMYTNLTNAGATRGYGVTQGTFAIMSLMRETAHELGMDYAEFLKKNLVLKGENMELCAFLEGAKHPETVRSFGLIDAMNKGKEMMDWDNKPASPAPNIKIGRGMAIMQQESGLPNLDFASANISLLFDGTFMLRFGGTDIGQGLNTVAVQSAAECLNTDMDEIAFLSADTDTTPFDVGSYASSGTHFSIGAILNACKDMRAKLLEYGAMMLKESIEDVKLAYPSKVVGKNGEITFKAIAHHTLSGTGKGELQGFGSFTTSHHATPYAAHFCEIELNTDTGKVKVKKYYAIHDCGVPINPTLTKGQIHGAVLQSIGHTLYEEMKFDENGICLNPDFLNYKMPKIKEVPEDFRVEFVYTDEEDEEFGARKSVGEIAMNGGAPAIADAIHDAAGIWMRSLPFTQEKILKTLGKF